MTLELLRKIWHKYYEQLDILGVKMQGREITGVDFRDKLFQLLLECNAEDDGLFQYYLGGDFKRSRRTNLFLGNAGRGQVWEGAERKFSRDTRKGGEIKKNDKKPCVLLQLHKRLYPELYDPSETKIHFQKGYRLVNEQPWDLVLFENMKFDCTYLSRKRIRTERSIYPIAWFYSWVIEVENEFEEFAFTLRGLMDVNCSKRMAIFFTDDVEKGDFDTQISEKFVLAWKLYKKPEYYNSIPEASLNLHTLIFPDTYKGIEQYLANAKMAKWDHVESTFVLAAPFEN